MTSALYLRLSAPHAFDALLHPGQAPTANRCLPPAGCSRIKPVIVLDKYIQAFVVRSRPDLTDWTINLNLIGGPSYLVKVQRD